MYIYVYMYVYMYVKQLDTFKGIDKRIFKNHFLLKDIP